MNNEIILGDDIPGSVGNMYIGLLATKAAYSPEMQKQLNSLIDAIKDGTTPNRAWAFEVTEDKFVCRAGQSSKAGAIHYMTGENFILVHKEG